MAALNSLGVPNADKWFQTHFDQRFGAQLSRDYADALKAYQSHISWVGANFTKFNDFGLKVQPSEMPTPLADSGFESLLPRPVGTLKIENYRFTSISQDPKHGPPSWVSSFVYIEGRFRFVGGTYPFWAERLTGLRGPMSIPPSVIHGRTVQGIAFRKDQVGAGIDGIVQLKVSVGRTGKVDHIKVLSGDQVFVNDAKDYVKAADFGELPDIPQFANAKRNGRSKSHSSLPETSTQLGRDVIANLFVDEASLFSHDRLCRCLFSTVETFSGIVWQVWESKLWFPTLFSFPEVSWYLAVSLGDTLQGRLGLQAQWHCQGGPMGCCWDRLHSGCTPGARPTAPFARSRRYLLPLLA